MTCHEFPPISECALVFMFLAQLHIKLADYPYCHFCLLHQVFYGTRCFYSFLKIPRVIRDPCYVRLFFLFTTSTSSYQTR